MKKIKGLTQKEVEEKIKQGKIIIILITMLLFRKYYIKIFSMVIKKIKKEK